MGGSIDSVHQPSRWKMLESNSHICSIGSEKLCQIEVTKGGALELSDKLQINRHTSYSS